MIYKPMVNSARHFIFILAKNIVEVVTFSGLIVYKK